MGVSVLDGGLFVEEKWVVPRKRALSSLLGARAFLFVAEVNSMHTLLQHLNFDMDHERVRLGLFVSLTWAIISLFVMSLFERTPVTVSFEVIITFALIGLAIGVGGIIVALPSIGLIGIVFGSIYVVSLSAL